MKKHIPIIIITFATAILIFVNLGNQFLWQDEAETAQLGKNILEYGYPKAFDGKNLVNPTIRTGFGENYAWKYHPWGQFYITALSFLFLGASTFAARLPFAVIGVVNVLMLYLLAYRLTRERFTANCAALLMAFSVPYLLLMRQCRYYAPAVFLVLFILFFYSKFREKGSNRDLALFSLGLVALGYTVHGMFIPVFAAIGLHYLVFSFDKRTFPKVAVSGILVLGAVVTWLVYSNSTAHAAAISPERLWKNLEFQVRMINKYIFPVVFFAAAYAVRAIWRRKLSVELSREEKDALKLIFTVIAISLFAFCFAEERNFRYLVYFIPLLGIVQGMVLYRLKRFNKELLFLFLFISLGTGVFNMGKPNYFLPKYIYEITHDYDGPIEGIVKFLDKNAEPGDTVKIIYGDLPLMFYTDLAVDNSNVYDDEHMPEWIVFRRGWHERLDNDYYTKVARTYKKYELDYPDIKWENRPGDLGYHKFATDKEAPKVIIFGRR
ncbi:MAG: glycosyltransferase family 39 protein, partial [Candidatus Omnitrophota bacterium]